MTTPTARAVPVLGVADVRAAVAWFCDVLGFACGADGVFAPPGDSDAVYAILTMDGAEIHLQIRRRPLPAEREGIESDAYVFVESADDLYARHRAAGAAIHRPIEDSDYGLRDYVVESPDGLRIVFGGPPD